MDEHNKSLVFVPTEVTMDLAVLQCSSLSSDVTGDQSAFLSYDFPFSTSGFHIVITGDKRTGDSSGRIFSASPPQSDIYSIYNPFVRSHPAPPNCEDCHREGAGKSSLLNV